MSHIRCAQPEGRLWCAESQGGPINTGLHRGRVPAAADIRRWMLDAVAGGSQGISFWVARPKIPNGEINGFALLDPAGDDSERLTEAGRIGRSRASRRAVCSHAWRPSWAPDR